MIRKNSNLNPVPLENIPDQYFNDFISDKNWKIILDEISKYSSVRKSAIDQLESIHLLRFGTKLSQSVLRLIKSGKSSMFSLKNSRKTKKNGPFQIGISNCKEN